MEDYIEQAVAIVDASAELPPDLWCDAVNEQARLLAGFPLDEPDWYTAVAIEAHARLHG
jgi:hypothetical protein